MDKKETINVINEIIEDSCKSMKVEAEKLLSAREWDFNQFGDRNTFARLVMECIFDKEKDQYKAIISNDRKAKQVKKNLAYELCFIHP